MKMSSEEIIVIPFPHPGHLFPAVELCRRLAERNCKVTVIEPTSSSSSPYSIHPLIHTVPIPIPDSIRIDRSFLESTLSKSLSNLLAERRERSSLPICAIVDEMASGLIAPFVDFGVPAVSFFTSSAISSALEHALSHIESPELHSVRDNAAFAVPGLPEGVHLTALDFANFHKTGPPTLWPGHSRRVRDVASTDGAVGLIMNTCVDLERPFLNYVAQIAGKPVWGVGPLLPQRFWASTLGARRGGEDGISEEEVLSWLDSKPPGSVIYVSFGSLVSPTTAELEELAAGLEESGRSFIWVIQPGARQHDPDGRRILAGEGGGEVDDGGYYPEEGWKKRVEGRGFVIKGWAPQLAILRHKSMGVYVCHCGWNSTLEALGYGTPVLAWPIRGDQTHNAKLLVNQLRVGVLMRSGPGKAVSRADVVDGIQKLFADEDMRKRANSIRSLFTHQLPRNSSTALNDFLDFLGSNCREK